MELRNVGEEENINAPEHVYFLINPKVLTLLMTLTKMACDYDNIFYHI